jgi:hypothetical protein
MASIAAMVMMIALSSQLQPGAASAASLAFDKRLRREHKIHRLVASF